MQIQLPSGYFISTPALMQHTAKGWTRFDTMPVPAAGAEHFTGTPNGAREGTKRAHWALTSAREDFRKSFSYQQGKLGLVSGFPGVVCKNKLAWT